jgi:heme a synthase
MACSSGQVPASLPLFLPLPPPLLCSLALDVYLPPATQQATANQYSRLSLEFVKKLRTSAKFNLGLVAFTAISGAYVAGNDAGRAYNTFPKMGDQWVPDEIFDLIPWWKNLFENTAMVQFNHRVLALTTYTSLSVMIFRAMNSTAQWSVVPNLVRIAMNSVATMAGVQVGLGIYTLLTHVPIPIAAAHQAGSLALITCVIGLIHSLGYGKYLPESVTKNVVSKVGTVAKKAKEKFQPAASLADIKKRVDQ